MYALAGGGSLDSESQAANTAAESSRLKVWREHRGVTRQQLAEPAKISLPYVIQIETGKRKVSVGVWVRLAAVLRDDVDDLLPG